ncbi:hypothetical protein SLEP1_g3325 [Rubroshorea leprosula]|uniref:protein-serine/threonine phosphatase n=3 Tax=Rubroshorea leprosula TaxID=152421 RepID=A0AAV5HTQ7_9ROSI|nr:hypothetical protein SLEP1_g3325 [Rubroshorea leprosula]
MEDYFDIKTSKINGQTVCMFGIFDGHGGSRAAEYLKERLFENLMKHPQFLTDTKTALSGTYQQTDEDFLDSERDTYRDDGSTASTAVLVGSHLYVANVGDSRTIISKAGKAIPLSEDHKPNRSDERKRIENAGGFIMWAGTWRVGGVLAMSRAFGNRMLKPFVVAEPEIQVNSTKIRNQAIKCKSHVSHKVQLSPFSIILAAVGGVLAMSRAFGNRMLKPFVVAEPEIQFVGQRGVTSGDLKTLLLCLPCIICTKLVDVNPATGELPSFSPVSHVLKWIYESILSLSFFYNNLFISQDQEIDEDLELLVLASDGLWDVVPNEDAVSLARTEEEPEAAARKLTETAFTRGSADNITCIVVRFHHNRANGASPQPG